MNVVARYEQNFDNYQILKPNDHDIVVIKDNNICDLVNDDVKKFIFQDVTKSYEELLRLNKSHILFKIKTDFKLGYDRVSFVKIVIRGYDESMDRLAFDVSCLMLVSAYKYSISNNNIEVVLDVDDSLQNLKEFISTIEYEYFNDISANNKHIYLYVNEDLIYNNKIEIS